VSRSIATALGLAAIALAIVSFVVLGVGRLLVGYRTAVLVAAPLGVLAFALAVALFVGFTLARLGVGPLSDDSERGSGDH
jgi:hypothetical protein